MHFRRLLSLSGNLLTIGVSASGCGVYTPYRIVRYHVRCPIVIATKGEFMPAPGTFASFGRADPRLARVAFRRRQHHRCGRVAPYASLRRY